MCHFVTFFSLNHGKKPDEKQLEKKAALAKVL